MNSFRLLNNVAGWLVFALAAIVLGAAAEPTGSLWDCGEFISGADKLQVVHPPGAPVFLLVGRLFAWVGSMVSKDPSAVAYSVNLMSALCTAFAAMFICWSTSILARIALVGRGNEPEGGQAIAVVGAGVVAGLTTAFLSSVWFSAVEGEVYAMSTFFTCMTLWAVLKWYNLPDTGQADRWLVFAIYSTGLSIGVHLLSLLTFPALAMFYYFKKREKVTVSGTLIAAGAGVLFILLVQSLIITGIPKMWAMYDKFMVNSLGLPFHSGAVLVLLTLGLIIWYFLRRTQRNGNGVAQRLVVAFGVMVISYLAYGMVVIRANANPPINMNNPSDAMRLLPYLNREQYGERPLLRGPDFDGRPVRYERTPRYGRVGDHYEVVEEKIDPVFSPNDETLFPRMGDYSQGRPALYRKWIDKPSGKTTFGDNIKFFVRYQIGWMYWRYFMWNFSGRQNGEQGYFSWDPSAGNWISGFDFYDEMRLGNQKDLPEFQKNSQARNKYYMIPFFLGLLGMFFHMQRRPRDFSALLALFIITGIGIIVYSNQPPNEPRERDYVLAGSFVTYAIWVGLGVLAIFDLLVNRLKVPSMAGAGVATLLALSAPYLLVTQNWDDHSRAKHFASRDYASNFLNSCAPNAIIFTYGDNDTYPLWYCQEVEGIRTDVRVVNLSLIAVDWYIEQLRRTVNNSPAIKMSMPSDKIRGDKRTQIPYLSDADSGREMELQQWLKFVADDHQIPIPGGEEFETYIPANKLFMKVNKDDVRKYNVVSDSAVVDTLHFSLGLSDKSPFLIKDQLAMLDIIANNLWDRPIYWAVTVREERLLGLQDYMQLEGLALRLVPVKSQSDLRAYGMVGAGRVADEIAFKNIMEKWAWGNFDKEKLFVDRSYMPSLQTMRVAMIRTGRQLVADGKKDEAVQLADKYFEVFPDYNFPNDQFTAFMADLYARAGAKDKAAATIRKMAGTLEEQMRFQQSLSPRFQEGYEQDYQYALGNLQTLLRVADDMKDSTLGDELEKQFQPYLPQQKKPALPGSLPQ